ncbi:hypothetical protein RHODGE_RHODGE_01027 [Rhodoplanes serenus]|uniref:Uncharacterized protein n=1 Tax=Rhodoplanes serenus TaxID=200615 RepID=A0A3S4AZ56_9BRAD|nr:hypothetical protein [Rhodoplanes serenus]VCU06580.1 hypothetical protein RHODPL_RHODPL_00028 [Rhodoplanes serenus]VCU07877.1 hypothetical protein RHODGE_RHODGE_01027 [Rhodoplanes serenus]
MSDARTVVIQPPKFEMADIRIVGVSPYVQNKFGHKMLQQMAEKQRAGSQAKKGRAREAKDFQATYEAAIHRSRDGWIGIPAPSFRNAMISACRIIGFKMTLAKLSVFVEADGFDAEDGTPLVKIIGEPRVHEGMVRNATGVPDIRWRPMWEQWAATVRVRWDASQFSAQDVVNLLARVGAQVGIGEGRPDSKNSAGMGWGLFEVQA